MTQALVSIAEVNPLVRRLEMDFRADELALALGASAKEVPPELWEAALLGPLREFLQRPGKMFRAKLLASAWRIAGGLDGMPREAELLVEVLHAGSLIIDDIQDGSVLRRGQRALHLMVGEPLAINAGNWLYFYAERLASSLGLPALAELELRRAMSQAVLRCHYGQALDLSTRITTLAQRDVPSVVSNTTRLKTGSLLELAGRTGALAARADASATAALGTFGETAGIGLQMLDDLSGIQNDRRCHKGHEDLLDGRPTWIWAWLAEELDELSYSRLLHHAREVEQRDLHPELLVEQIRAKLGVVGQLRIRQHFSHALDGLRLRFGNMAEVRAVESELALLEQAYA